MLRHKSHVMKLIMEGLISMERLGGDRTMSQPRLKVAAKKIYNKENCDRLALQVKMIWDLYSKVMEKAPNIYM
jgi:hypothetical protein